MIRHRRIAGVVLLVLLAARAAQAQPVRLQGALVPAPLATTAGTGTVTIVFDDNAGTLRVQVSFAGLTGNTTSAHIHCCTTVPGTGNAAVATTTPSFPGFPVGVTSGTYDVTFDLSLSSTYNAAFVTGQGGIANARAALLNGLRTGQAYFDIHSSVFPGGEVRTFPSVVYTVGIANASRVEGNSGTATMAFMVSLAPSSPSSISVVATANNGSAVAGSDFAPAGPTTVTFSPGETTKAFNVSVIGDVVPEFDETFTVTLSAPTGAVLGTGVATGTILNDDGTPQPPVVANDSYSTTLDTPLSVAAPGVLANDQSPAPGLAAALLSPAAHGTVVLQPSGSFSYLPNAGFIGADAFTYRASNIAGQSPVATVSIAVTVPTGPVAPSAFRVVGTSGTSVTFAWNPPEIGSTPLGYQLEGGLAPGDVLGIVPLGVAPRFTIALPAATLYVRLRTVAASGVSAPTADITVPVNQPVPPSAPANLLGLASGTTLSLAWRTTFRGGPPTGVVLDVTGSVNTTLALGPADTFDFAGVPAGTYTFAVRAVNAFGSSLPSNTVTLTFPGCSGAPAPVDNLVAFALSGRLVIAWDPGSAGPAPTSYVIDATGSYTGSVPVVTRGVDVAVSPGSYTLRVRAVNACGTSPASAPRTVIVP